jgi:hypothetical protein
MAAGSVSASLKLPIQLNFYPILVRERRCRVDFNPSFNWRRRYRMPSLPEGA